MLSLTRLSVQGVTAPLLLAAALAGCGESQVDASGPAPTGQVPGELAVPPTTASSNAREMPTAREVEASQSKVIARSQPGSGSEVGSTRTTAVVPGKQTAPASVIELARMAARQWLIYRVSGHAPDEGVIPRRVWDGVAPMVPTEQVKGAPRLSGLVAFAASPADMGWRVSVATEDPRASTLAIDIDQDKTVTAVTG